MSHKLPNTDMPVTNFDYSHCHKWLKSIKDKDNIPQYRLYWQRMAEKMQLISSLILNKIAKRRNNCEPTVSEVNKYNRPFVEDMSCLLDKQELADVIKKCLDLRIKENFQIIRCALIMRNIVFKYGIRYLNNIIEEIKNKFANRFYQQRNSKMGYRVDMFADHDLERKMEGETMKVIFYNCPIFGAFKYIDREEIAKEFCILCHAHAKKMIQENRSSRNEIYLHKSFAMGDDHCEFLIQ